MPVRKDIAIIGGGFTGLTAAYYLAQKNYKITIFEREKFLGGLASGFEIDGESIEKTYHHIFPSDKYIIQLVGELGLSDKLHWFDSSVGLYFNGQVMPFSGALDLLKFSNLNFIDRIRTGFVIFALSKFTNWKDRDSTSAFEWLLRWGGKKAMDVIWKPLLKGKFHRYFKDVSLPWLWARMHTRASNRKIWEKSEKLGYFEGGFQIIIDTLIDRLKIHDVEIRTETSIDLISRQGERVDITFNNETRSFESVITTVPNHIFSKMIGEEKYPEYSKKLNSVDYLGAITMVFSSSQDIGKYYWLNVNDLEFPFLVFLNHTNLVPKEWYKGKYIYYLGTYIPHSHRYFDMDQESISKEWFKYLKKIYPYFDESKLNEKYLFKFRNAQHVVTKGYSKNISSYKTPIQGVYLSNFSQIYPEDRGTNFAVREGIKIVETINQNR